jgi:hypothetical protein
MATRYKQPSRINTVSVGLLLLAAAGAWIGVSAWPLIALNASVKTEITDALPRVHHANLLPEPAASDDIARIDSELQAKLRDLGVTDPALDVVIGRGSKTISIEARYRADLVLLWLGKRFPLSLAPRVETEAARVTW